MLNAEITGGKSALQSVFNGRGFDNFINVGLTRKDCVLTTTSPGPYTLRLTIDPTYQMDVYSGSINIINATSSTDITAISLNKV